MSKYQKACGLDLSYHRSQKIQSLSSVHVSQVQKALQGQTGKAAQPTHLQQHVWAGCCVLALQVGKAASAQCPPQCQPITGGGMFFDTEETRNLFIFGGSVPFRNLITSENGASALVVDRMFPVQCDGVGEEKPEAWARLMVSW